MEKSTLLSAVKRNVGIVEIEHDLARRAFVGFQENIDQQAIDPRAVAIDLVIFGGMALGRVLETIERALARQGLAIGAQRRL